MKKKQFTPFILLVFFLCLPGLAIGAEDPIAAEADPTLVATVERLTLTQEEIAHELSSGFDLLDRIRRLGLAIFTTPFNLFDGYGDGPFDMNEYGEDPPETFAFGKRPTLQGNGLLLRVNGLDAQSCNECHVFVSQKTRPPTLGIGGVGGVATNAIILPSLIDVADSSDDRVFPAAGHNPDLPLGFDGVADYNGRFANPPFLFGGGGVELLGKEMTADLQELLQDAREAPSDTVISLNTHRVNFGFIRSLGGGNVELHVEGIGPEDISGVPPEEVLVVRPFGRKGENFTMRDFDRGAMQFHFGIQPVEVVGRNVDGDGDGVVDEVTVAEMTVLHVFDVTNPRPTENLNLIGKKGKAIFNEIGCTMCHRPALYTESNLLPLAYPEVAEDPSENVYARINLVRVGFEPYGEGVKVPLYSDLKRHDMGPGLAETFERGEIANEEFITARLWGIADTAPYLHDGRATTIYEALDMHGGEAQDARDNFKALPLRKKGLLLGFLNQLRTPEDPNVELLD